MPAATDVGVEHDHLDAVLRARPDLADDLRRAMASAGEGGRDAVQALRHTDAPAYRALVLLAFAAYYRAPDVQARIGWAGPVATPVGRFDFPEYLSEGLLDHLIPKEPA